MTRTKNPQGAEFERPVTAPTRTSGTVVQGRAMTKIERNAELRRLMGEPPIRISQARRVIDALGGPRAIAKGTGINCKHIYRWDYPKDRGGTSGVIPTASLRKVLAWARAIGVGLSPTDLDPRETTV